MPIFIPVLEVNSTAIYSFAKKYWGIWNVAANKAEPSDK